MKRKPALILGVAFILLASLLMVPAVAVETGLEAELEKLESELTSTSSTTTTTSTTTTELQKTEDDDSDGHETKDPVPPDHASGEVAYVELGGTELVTLNSTRAEVRDDGSSSADVTLLAIGGEEIRGAHSDSDKTTHDEEDPLANLCAGSDGQVCIGILFAEADSTEDADSSQAEAEGALLFACVSGGDNDAETAECEGKGDALGVGVATSDSTITKDKTTGATEAEQQTDVADVCVGGEDATTGICSGVGASAVHAESKSTANDPNQPGTTERSSYLLAVEVGGERHPIIEDPMAIAFPSDCPTSGSLVCVFFNQGESFISDGAAASRQEAIDVKVGRTGEETSLLFGHVSTAETLVTNTGPQCPPVCPDGLGPDEVRGERVARRGPTGPGAGVDAGVEAGRAPLPFTGVSILFGLVALGLMLAGGALVGRSRQVAS